MRLSQESHSATIVARQSQCLLACINSLNLVTDKYKWIVRPVVDSNYPDEANPKKKRSIDGREVLHYKVKKQVEVLELAGIKKEYYLVDARLKLSKFNPEMHAIAQACPSELIAILSSVGLYTTALHLCDQFNLPKSPVLENLASHSLRLSQQEDPNAWDWLIQNDVFGKNTFSQFFCLQLVNPSHALFRFHKLYRTWELSARKKIILESS